MSFFPNERLSASRVPGMDFSIMHLVNIHWWNEYGLLSVSEAEAAPSREGLEVKGIFGCHNIGEQCS